MLISDTHIDTNLKIRQTKDKHIFKKMLHSLKISICQSQCRNIKNTMGDIIYIYIYI